MIPQKLYPHLPERSYGEHVMQIAQKLIDTGLTKSHQYRLDHWELKRIQAQNQVREEDKKYLFIPYCVLAKTEADVRPRIRIMSRANSK